MKITDTIGLVLKSKDEGKVLMIAPEQTVYEALEVMAEHNVGALLCFPTIAWSVSCRSATTRAREFCWAFLPG